MSPNEKRGRAYCAAIGADPDAIVWGYFAKGLPWTSAPRWCWYAEAT